jgi:Tfp pilus assembly protein PilF
MNVISNKWQWLVLCLITLLASGCTSVQPEVRQPHSPAVAKLLEGEAFLGHKVTEAELPDYDLLAITPEMLAFAQKAVRRETDYFERVRALHVALLSAREQGGHGIVYNAYTTETPQNTFASRRANCLSFTLLYVALARQVGIKAKVNEVDIPPTWDLRNKNDMVFLRHVNVRVPLLGENRNILKNDDVIIDLEMDRYNHSYPQRDIDDNLSAAQFYSNRAMEYLDAKDLRNSFLFLRKAISLNDQQSYIWSNLGALYGRLRLLPQAEQAYIHALSINPNDLTVMNNLAFLYQHTGNKAGAAKYLKLAQRYREANPFYQYSLALSAFEDEQYDIALGHLKRAMLKEKEEVRFLELAVKIYEKKDEKAKVASLQRQLKKLRPPT